MRSYKVRNDKGQTFDVDEKNIHEAEKDGFLPVVSNGKEEHRVQFDNIKMAMNDGYKPLAQSDVGYSESGLRGVAQGVSFGLSDEITGALESAFTDKTYEQARDESRAAYKEAQEANPLTYGAGEIGGAVGTAFVPGLGALNAAKGAKLATVVGKSALQGGLAGLGLSEADDLSGMAKDTALGLGLGATGGLLAEKVLMPAAGVVGSGIKKGAQYIDEKLPQHFGKIVAGVPEEATERYLKNPKAVNEALSRDELAEVLLDEVPNPKINPFQKIKDDGSIFVKGRLDPQSSMRARQMRAGRETEGALQQLKQIVSESDAKAWQQLSTNPDIKKTDVLDDIYAIAKEEILNPKGTLSRTDGAGASAERMRAVEKQLDEINKAYPEMVSEHDLKAMVKDMQDLAYQYAGSPKYTNAAEGIRGLESKLRRYLEAIPEYDQAMHPVREGTDTLKDLERNFVNAQDSNDPSKLFQKMNRWRSTPESSPIKSSIREMDRMTGMGLGEEIENTLAKEAFEKSHTNGSRNTVGGSVIGGVAGTITGGPFGGLLGGAAGSVVGQTADKYAGVVFKKMLNQKLAVDSAMEVIGPHLGKFAKPLADAAKRGNNSLAATHFMLQQISPEYRDILQKMNKDQ